MPRWIFWAGVAASVLVSAVFLAWGAGALFVRDAVLPGTSSWIIDRGATFGAATLVFTLPLAALLLRMAARLASRRIFEAMLTLFAVTGASIVILATALVLTMSSEEGARIAAGGLALSTVFVALSVLTLRSYFEVQSSRTLSLLSTLPLPLTALVAGVMLATGGTLDSARALFGVMALSSAATFAGIAVHATRHRQLLLESSGLRDLLAHAGGPGRGEGGDPIALSQQPLPNG